MMTTRITAMVPKATSVMPYMLVAETKKICNFCYMKLCRIVNNQVKNKESHELEATGLLKILIFRYSARFKIVY